MVTICELTLNEREECILYTCIALATTSEWNNERLYNFVEVRGVIGQMLEKKQPGITKTDRFANFHPKTLVTQFRNPNNATAKRVRERVGNDSGQYLEQVSKLFEQHKRLVGPPGGGLAPTTRLVLGAASLQPGSPQPSAQGSTEPLVQQYPYPSNNPGSLRPPAPRYHDPSINPDYMSPTIPPYHDLGNNPAYPQPPAQPSFDSRINPQYSAYDQPGGQQVSPLGSDYSSYAGSGYQQRFFPGGIPGDTGYQQPHQSARANPYPQVSTQGRDSQSGLGVGQAQTEAKAIIKIGDDEFNSSTDYMGGQGRVRCTALLGHDHKHYGARGHARPASSHAADNYEAWKEQATAKHNPDASDPSSTLSGGSNQLKPKRRRLEDQGSQGKAGKGQEKTKKAQGKDNKGARRREESPSSGEEGPPLPGRRRRPTKS